MCKLAFLNVLRTIMEMWMDLVPGTPETHELGKTSTWSLRLGIVLFILSQLVPMSLKSF